jgi:hypothetical protein
MPSNLFLDDYPNASIAYSFRKLRNNYTGGCINVTRTSDNTNQVIGFVNNYLDTNALKSFVGSSDGLIFQWFDQSGNAYTAEASSINNRPAIVSGGNIVYQNGKVAADFNPTVNAKAFVVPSNNKWSTDGYWMSIVVTQLGSTSSTRTLLVADSTASTPSRIGYFLYNVGTTSTTGGYTSATFTSDNGNAVSVNNRYLYVGVRYTGFIEMFVNGATNGATSRSGTNNTGQTSGRLGRDDFNQNWYGKIQEVIHYGSDKYSSLSGIQSNINTYYSIY